MCRSKTFIDEISQFKPDVVGLSGFLTLAFDSMKETIAAIQDAGLRDRLKIMIGGGQVDEAVRNYTGADAFGTNAIDAVLAVQELDGSCRMNAPQPYIQTPEAKAAYDARWQRIMDCVALKQPDRMPTAMFATFWLAKFGGISHRELMYDYDKAKEIAERGAARIRARLSTTPWCSMLLLGPVTRRARLQAAALAGPRRRRHTSPISISTANT